MNNLTDSNLSKLSQYLQSHREKTSLQLEIKFSTNQQKNLQIIKDIQEELPNLTHLTDLTLLISNHSVLTSEGYRILSDAVLNLKKLKKLQIQIDWDCYLENEGLSIFSDMINQLLELEYLKLQIRENNYIKAEAVQAFLDSLVVNTQLTTLYLYLDDIQSSLMNQGNIHLWRGISNLDNLQKLKLCFSTNNYGYSDLIELFAILPNLNKLRRLHLRLYNGYLQDTSLLDELFTQLGKMTELRSLKICYGWNNFTLNAASSEAIITNLSNLKFLEKLRLINISEHFLGDSFEEYINLIRDLKYLKELEWYITDKSVEQINSLGQSLLELKNLIKLDLSITLENSLQWDGFFQDLSVSFRQIPNLLSLKLEFLKYMSKMGNIILGESFGYLQKLERLELSMAENEKMNIIDLLYGIRKLSNLKELEIFIEGEKWEDEEETALLDSISYLSKLERLHLVKQAYSYSGNKAFQNLESLSATLMNLRKLKSLKCKIFISNLDSQNQIDAFEKCFVNLQDLEYLNIVFNIEQQSDILQSTPMISHLINLKRLEINFEQQYFNIFGASTSQYLQKLEECWLNFKIIEAEQLIKILELLSLSNIKALSLNIEILNKCEGCKEQFEMVFSKLSNLEELSFFEKETGNLMIYFNGITQMKSLEYLELESNVKETTQQDLYLLDLTLKQLKNLQSLNVQLNEYHVFSEDTSQLNSDYEDIPFYLGFNQRYIEVRQVCSLDLTQLNPKNQKNHGIFQANLAAIADNQQKGSEVLFDQSEVNLDNQLINAGYLKESTQELNLSKVKIDIGLTDYKENSITLSEFDFHNSQYINQLIIECDFNSQSFVELKLLQPLRDLTSESKLIRINLGLDNLILSEEQISYFSRNFKFLTNLQQLTYFSKESMDYYFLLFDSFKYLINLQELKIQSSFSEKDAISLGKSLNSMFKLQECSLTFTKKSYSELAGIISIFTGLKQANKLKQLDLAINSDQIIDVSRQIPISECFSNLKQLHQLSFSLGINRISSNSLREFFTSIGSLMFLNTLEINLKYENPISQDMLDQLINSLSKLTNLKRYKISIHLENITNNLGQNFITLCNLNLKSEKTITFRKKQVLLQENPNIFSLAIQSLESLEVNFLELLSEKIQVSLEIEDTKILNNIKLCASRKIELKLNDLRAQENIDNVCDFMSKIPNIFQLGVKVLIHKNVNQEEELITMIAQSITKLKTLKVLNLKFSQKYQTNIDCPVLMKALKILKTMEELQSLYLKSGSSDEVNEKMIPKILRAIPRLVILDQFKQISSEDDDAF